MMFYTQADICRGLGHPAQHFKAIDGRHPLPEPDEVGVACKDGTGARRYWHEGTVVDWAAREGLAFDPARARRG